MFLKQNTTVTVRMGPALDATDGVTEETALSPTVEISKSNGAFAARNSATAITHDSNGWYAVELNATDTNTVGRLIAKFDDAATHLPVWHEFYVLEEAIFDSLFAANAAGFDVNGRVDVSKLNGDANSITRLDQASKSLVNKAVQDKATGVIDYYDDDGTTVILTHTPTDGASTITRTPS